MAIGALALNRRGSVPGVQQKTARTAKNAMTDGYVKKIQSLARQDAAKGEYMGKEAIMLQQSQMRQYVSPDRSGAIAKVSSVLQEIAQAKAPMLVLLEKLLDGYSAEVRGNFMGQTAEICAPNGEVIASYNSLGSGWTEIQTQEEHRFFSESATVYLQAYREARAEMRAAQGGVDIQA